MRARSASAVSWLTLTNAVASAVAASSAASYRACWAAVAGARVVGLRHLDATDRAGDRQDPDEHPQCQGQTLPGLPHPGIVGRRVPAVREAGIARPVP